ncbi:glycosyltransferase family 2 protein [Nocardioides lianchengensis]|uniref:Hyaluronan synthase n=1 Tax=Nocardioides lianchengensis TaxID=1045774 RepID=A0A1G6PZB5_9ACTN|nr:glycosyltransferase family 2 protein [Nocardioides lianchengensis]NYG12035.1 hyaluronan synthase [Nocardioides lianchengensis]SDC85419.1 hyaluronan synthase [Nocardioides lianchengensis]
MTAVLEPELVVPAEPAPTPAPHRRVGWAHALWRLTVVAYAAALLVFVLSLKVGDALATSLVLQVYAYLLAAYLVTRVAVASRYRPDTTTVPDADLPSLVIAVPAFNEEAHVEDTIDALFRVDYPADKLRVVVVDDGSSDDTWARIKASAVRHPLLDGIKFSRNRGKRAAMAAAVRAADGADLVVFVDSDSVLEPQALRELVKPFVGDRTGRVAAVTGHADVQNPGTNLLTRLQQVRYFAAFRVIKAAESRYGAVTCASGCFSAYRRSELLEVLHEWENQRFLGQEATFGDDRALTNALLRRGREVRYQSTAVSATLVPDRWKAFLTQQLRWKKSWLRETLYVVRFAWRWPLIAAFGVYASVLFQLLGPLVALHSLVIRPVFLGGSPWLYLVGLQVVAVLYGLLYAGVKRSPHWWGGIAYAFAYSAVISWQIYWAMLTQRNTSWGTRDSSITGEGPPLAVAEVVGEPGDTGLPLLCAPGRRLPAVPSTLAERPAVPDWDAATRRDWVVGVLAVPLSSLPVLWWVFLR